MTRPALVEPAHGGMPDPFGTEASTAPRRLFALKHADTFLVADAVGDVLGDADGLFTNDTRMLSWFRLTLGDELPSLLGASVSQDNVFFLANVTNRPLPPLGEQATPEGVIHIERARFLWQERLYEHLTLVNYGEHEVRLPLAFFFGADFRDIFEVRGAKRAARGQVSPPEVTEEGVLLRYRGLDGVERSTSIAFSLPPSRLTGERADFTIALPKRRLSELYLEIGPGLPTRPTRERYRTAAARARANMRRKRRRSAALSSSGRLFNDWIAKSRADLALLTTELPTGPYPYAGIPWFCTTFGRDAILTALQVLWLDPSVARGVLRFLAQNQARETSTFEDSSPGKVLHETRRGEMAALREVPFGRYYGSVDTTPLFVVLAGAYAVRTADLELVAELWPALEAAMGWIEGAGDGNRDGLLDYQRGEGTGLTNQGWKDSVDSIFHADGAPPQGPVALVEVQGYVYAAFSAMAELSERRGMPEEAERWRQKAGWLRAEVEARFWMEDAEFYAIALDGAGRLCRVRASNAGHLLWVGLPAPERAARVIQQLLSSPFYSGWGIRTLPRGETRFNPMSYHNGSVWPHDTALCAAGLARYGERNGVVRLLAATFEAAVHFEMRLPELFCGFHRAPGEAPIAYPVACLPQAWSSGAVFMLLQACLGLTIDGRRREIQVERPELPVGIDRLTLSGLAVGEARVDLVFQRLGRRVVASTAGHGDGSVAVLSRV